MRARSGQVPTDGVAAHGAATSFINVFDVAFALRPLDVAWRSCVCRNELYCIGVISCRGQQPLHLMATGAHLCKLGKPPMREVSQYAILSFEHLSNVPSR